MSEWQHNPFYDTPEWRAKRKEVLDNDKECQLCKARGRFGHAEIAHHVLHLEDRPDLALEDYYIDANGVKHRQIIAVCKWCHENVCHPDRLRKGAPKEPPITAERWD